MHACSGSSHIFSVGEPSCHCGAMLVNDSPRGMFASRGPAAHPQDLLDGEVQLSVHWRDALVAGRELAASVEAWRETGNPVALAAAVRMERVAKALEEQGVRGAAREREERAARGQLVEEGLQTS